MWEMEGEIERYIVVFIDDYWMKGIGVINVCDIVHVQSIYIYIDR